MINNIDKFKKSEKKEEEKKEPENKKGVKVNSQLAICPNCRKNKEGVLKIPLFEQLGVEGLRVCKECGVVFMDPTFLEIVKDSIKNLKDKRIQVVSNPRIQ